MTSNQDPEISMANAPDEIREFVRQRESEKGQSSIPSKPRVGLLSHTVVPSPTIQWILPAHLRSQRHNDVVFVGDRHIQIREAVSGIHLEDVTSKSDFDAQIMAAKVINVDTELPWETQMKQGAGHLATSEPQDDLPPQVLVLSLASRELVFLYYSMAGEGQFVSYRRPLPNDVNLFEQFGRNVAVEPRSRAIAVSASCDYFGIFMLKEPPVLQSQMTNNQLDPILEERFFRVDGDILFMEFLYPKSEGENKIILLLLVAQSQITHAICYEWDANIPLRNAPPRVTRRLLPFEDRLPTMVIPLTKTSSFMLVTPSSMAVYKNRLDPRRQPSRYPLPFCDKQAQRSPLWTRWARPLRNWIYNQKHDDIYLCREDGRIFYLEIGNEGEIENQTFLGLLHCDVDAAFDTLDIGHEGGDLLLAAGNMGDGGLFVQKARDHPRCVQKFMNWTPVTDSVVVKSTTHDSLTADVASDRLFVCSASTFGKGAVSEIRYGIEAQIGLAVALEGLSSTRDIWTMADNVNGGVCILTTDPVSSLLIYMPADFGEEICAIDEEESGLDFSCQTLAAGCTQSGAIVQVTETAVHLGAVAESPAVRHDYGLTENVAAAAINESAGLVATAIRSHKGSQLHLIRINSTDSQHQLSGIGAHIDVNHEPVSMSIERLGFSCFIFIGTGSGKLLIYRVVEDTITFLTDIDINVEESVDISKAIESLAIISIATGDSLEKAILFCGLRSGILVSFGVTIDNDNINTPISMKQGIPQRLGHTSVKVQSKGNAALLTCGEGFWQVSCVEDGDLPEYTLQRVWITDQNNPAYYPKSIYGFTTSNVVNPNIDDAFNSLFCVADEQLFICTLDREARTVPRRINLPGSANRLAYSNHLKSLIVSYTQTELDTSLDPVRRFTRPMVDFIDPDFQDSAISLPGTEEGPQTWRPQGAAGEKITCILEWTPRKGDEEYHLIVIGTARKNQQERGRVIFLQTSRDASNPSQIECSVKYVHKFEGPVYAITPYGPFTLMVSSGHEIIPLEPKFSRTRWGRAARYSTVSPAISISAHEPYVYLSTARESLMVLKASDDKLSMYAYDRHRHDGLSHVHIGGPLNLTVASSRGGTVSVLTERGVTETDKMMPHSLCEAHLPLSVMKLSLGSKLSPLNSSSRVLYGSTINGTTYRFLTLGERDWRLLRLLQDMCEKDPRICPFSPKRKRLCNPVESESVESSPSRMHIDGDILSRLVARGAGYLHRMLVSGDLYDLSSHDTGTTQATMERFSVLAEDALGRSTNQVEAVMKWLRNTLHMQF